MLWDREFSNHGGNGGFGRNIQRSTFNIEHPMN
jgi:hypothetical protein